jgi:alpha-ribazole phosphatase
VAEGICYGQTDLELAEDVAALAAVLRAQLPIDAPVFSSPLCRCRKLAEALHQNPRFDARLMEMNFGEWEMRAWDDIGAAALDDWAKDPYEFAPPGGESPSQLFGRVTEFHAMLVAENIADAVLVTHAGVMRAICGLIKNLLPDEWMKLSFAFGSVTVLDSTETD